MLTFHGTKDPIVPYSQSEVLDAALRKVGSFSQVETIEGKGHGDWAGEDWSRVAVKSLEFLDKQLRQK